MSTVEELFVETDAEEARIKEATEAVQAKKLSITRRFRLKCQRCNGRRPIKEWGFIQQMHYIEPFSCTGGDYWSSSKTEVCHVVCPVCGRENYIYNHPQKNDLLRLLTKACAPLDTIFATHKERHSRH